VVYANNRQVNASLTWRKYGRDGKSFSDDPTINKEESGHPIKHAFTRAIPTAQCMNCHMHQPNMFVNTYLGYTMWDYEADAPFMWPEKQKYPTTEEIRHVLDRNPEGAAPKGNWADLDFLRNVFDLNGKLNDTQFADYHGHGWNFRGIFKRDRDGNLLDAKGEHRHRPGPGEVAGRPLSQDRQAWPRPGRPGSAPERRQGRPYAGHPRREGHAVRRLPLRPGQPRLGRDLRRGRQCGGDPLPRLPRHRPRPIRRCAPRAWPADPKGNDLTLLRNPDGQRRFEWVERDGRQVLVQRSLLDPNLEWRIHLVKDTVDPTSPDFNARSARAKLMSKVSQTGRPMAWGPGVGRRPRAHRRQHGMLRLPHLVDHGLRRLPPADRGQLEDHQPQVRGRGDAELRHLQPAGGARRHVPAGQAHDDQGLDLRAHPLVLGPGAVSTNVNRERIYVQQPPIAASGFSSQAFAPHFPHTVRKTETKTCSDCHVSADNDNNAIMAQLLLLGPTTSTSSARTPGSAWAAASRRCGSRVGRAAGGVRLLPAQVRLPDFYKLHVEAERPRTEDLAARQAVREGPEGRRGRGRRRHHTRSTRPTAAARCLQLRGEYMYVAEGKGGFRAFDVASIATKASRRRSSPRRSRQLRDDTHVISRNATCVRAADQPEHRAAAQSSTCRRLNASGLPLKPGEQSLLEANQEQQFLPIYSYAVITDSEEGLILVNVNTLADGDPRNNNLKRAVTWNEGGVLKGARHVTPGRPLRLHRRRRRPGGGRPGRTRCTGAEGHRAAL
jgi:hypothetical protein